MNNKLLEDIFKGLTETGDTFKLDQASRIEETLEADLDKLLSTDEKFERENASVKGKNFEAKVKKVLEKLQAAFPEKVTIVEQPKLRLYDDQDVIPDFDLQVDLFFEKAGYLIECQHRKRSKANVAQKIKYIKGLSKRNRFIFIYAESIPKATEKALRADGVLCMSFAHFVIFIAKISVTLEQLSTLYGDATFDEVLDNYISNNKHLIHQLSEEAIDESKL